MAAKSTNSEKTVFRKPEGGLFTASHKVNKLSKTCVSVRDETTLSSSCGGVRKPAPATPGASPTAVDGRTILRSSSVEGRKPIPAATPGASPTAADGRTILRSSSVGGRKPVLAATPGASPTAVDGRTILRSSSVGGRKPIPAATPGASPTAVDGRTILRSGSGDVQKPSPPPASVTAPTGDVTVWHPLSGGEGKPSAVSTDGTEAHSDSGSVQSPCQPSTDVYPPAEPDNTATAAPLPIGAKIGQHREYTVEYYLGKGGFGHTYRVRKGEIQHVVKECAPSECSFRMEDGRVVPVCGREGDFQYIVQAFENEVKILNKSNGKDTRIVHLVDKFSNNNTKYYTMEYLPGGSLEDYRKTLRRSLTEKELLKVLGDLLGALDALHTRTEAIHRDIKPKNIMRTESDDSKLIDFGSACFLTLKAKAAHALSEAWAPPEEFSVNYTENIGPHTDIYELGATVYYLITEKFFNPPELKEIYDANKQSTTAELVSIVAPVIQKRIEEIRGMEHYSVGFRNALCKALQPDIENRIHSAKEWIDMLSSAALAEAQEAKDFAEIKARVDSHPEDVDRKMLATLTKLCVRFKEAHLVLAHFYRYSQKNNAEKKEQHHEEYIKHLLLAAEHGIRQANAEYAECLLEESMGRMDEDVLTSVAQAYERGGYTEKAAGCLAAIKVRRVYRITAILLGWLGIHNILLATYGQARCSFRPVESGATIQPMLRGVLQALCFVFSLGFCGIWVWLMALSERNKITRYIYPYRQK